ncbi:hypothetical protein G6F57_006171 [Rhizopus arrhizus]|uniref:Galactose oxidase n=1 Tax=Rhizopus oryzae TaxID=64495 RepID=A0A9P6XFW4_RHIOR|nr:hypothetical protein G6F23_007228 [Rhizopus arrhizus]KAG1422527.1 hypothetical protein G6F58_003251 [Rhizopus delemar]KAG0762792.1 hypothetical protein G6F24_006530 [Rhizopus arrhizus]KAG0794472.1 hypothetical protein G6F21_002833 [Rhizopus arrhizus]KAG0798833.1 hypothetical protein G6F22_003827 [Rhizopus arrhizus]
MTDKPTSPIAWMANAYSPTASSFKEKRQSSFTLETKTMNSNQSIESFDRPESPTLPPETTTTTEAAAAVTESRDSTDSSSQYPSDSVSFYQHKEPPPTPMKRAKSKAMTDPIAAAIELSVSAQVPPAPAAGMYWSRAMTFGKCPTKPLRAHTANLIGENLYVFGGCDMKACFNTLYVLDMDTLTWTKPRTTGQVPPPCRAHSCTTVERVLGPGKRSYSLYVFGGGDGPNYFNDLYILNVDTLTWTKPKTVGEPPSPRRAHTTCLWNQKIIVIGGGDGARALADVHALDISDPNALTWTQLQPQGTPPIARGYHTSNLVKNKLIIYGGSDGHECFSDIFILDLLTNCWSQIDLNRPMPRLAHSTTQVGSYLFVTGGYDGRRYSNELLLLNLVTMCWETKKVYGNPPSPRGYHVSILHDSRIYVLGGYDGRNVFEDVYMLELSACAYLPQITNFDIDV